MNPNFGTAEQHRDEIVRRYTQNQQTIRYIAGQLQLSYSGVRSVLDRAGVELRSVGRPRTKPAHITKTTKRECP